MEADDVEDKMSVEKEKGDSGSGSGRDEEPGKVMSARERFVPEQLPQERRLRPDDLQADAMRNMAHLWRLTPTKECEAFLERSPQAAGDGICERYSAIDAEKPEVMNHFTLFHWSQMK